MGLCGNFTEMFWNCNEKIPSLVTTEKFFTGYVMLQVENEMNDYNISGGSRGGAWEARPGRFILDKKLKKKELEKEEKPAVQSTKNRPSPPLAQGLDLPLNMFLNWSSSAKRQRLSHKVLKFSNLVILLLLLLTKLFLEYLVSKIIHQTWPSGF